MSAHATAGQEPGLQPGACQALDFPCSLAQQGFWLLERLMPDAPALNIAARWRIDGPVARDLLEQAFQQVVARHEALRTTFHDVDGAPVQRVLPAAPFNSATLAAAFVALLALLASAYSVAPASAAMSAVR